MTEYLKQDITSYEKLRELLDTKEYKCFRSYYHKDKYSTEVYLGGIIYADKYYIIDLKYTCTGLIHCNFNNYFGQRREKDYWFSYGIHCFYNTSMFVEYDTKILEAYYDMCENYSNLVNAYAKLYEEDPELIDEYLESVGTNMDFTVNRVVLHNYKNLKEKKKVNELYTLESKYDNTLGSHTIDNSVKIIIYRTPENEHKKKVFDFIQVELPIYNLNLKDKKNMDKVKRYVLERIEKDKKFKKYGVPINILKCYAVTRDHEFVTFRFEIKDIKEEVKRSD